MKKEYETPSVKRIRFEVCDTLMDGDTGNVNGPSYVDGGGTKLPWETQGTNGYNSRNNPY